MRVIKFVTIGLFIYVTIVIILAHIVVEPQPESEYELILINQNIIQVKEISTGTTVKCNPDSLVFVLEELNR